MSWTCTDWSDYDREGTFEIESVQQLCATLRTYESLPPRVILLEWEGGNVIRLGIGGPLGFLTWDREPDFTASAIADPVLTQSSIEFDGWETIEQYPERLISVEDLVAITVEVFERKSLSSRVAWKVWDSSTESWERIGKVT